MNTKFKSEFFHDICMNAGHFCNIIISGRTDIVKIKIQLIKPKLRDSSQYDTPHIPGSVNIRSDAS